MIKTGAFATRITTILDLKLFNNSNQNEHKTVQVSK